MLPAIDLIHHNQKILQPMAIIDVVSWSPKQHEQLFAWRFPHTNLSTYTQLIVAESQEALIFSQGQLLGRFGPGRHTLLTENLPILREVFGIPFGGKNPFTAEVWFVNKLVPLNLEWSTDSMMYHDPDYNTMVPLAARGRYGIRVSDAEMFLIKLVGTAPSYSAAELTDHNYGASVAKIKSTLLGFIQHYQVGVKTISAHLDRLSLALKDALAQYWADYGLTLMSFYITTLEVDANTPEGIEIRKAMTQQSAQIIAGYTWQQAQVFGTAGKALDGMAGVGGGGGVFGAVLATSLMGNLSGSGLLSPVPSKGQQEPTKSVPSGTSNSKSVFCSACSQKFSRDKNFCPNCGDPYCPCPRCGADNDSNSSKCVFCSFVLSAKKASCHHCKADMDDGAAFCSTCGKPAPQAAGLCKKCGAQVGNKAFCSDCGTKNA